MDRITNEQLEKAKLGSNDVLEEIVDGIQEKVYSLALRMLYDPFDAEDASQEILIRIITHLGTFKGDSAFETWVYRVACNHLLNIRKMKPETEAASFCEYADNLDTSTPYTWDDMSSDPMQNLIIEDVRISCLQGMLLCLDRNYRIVFILSEVFYVSSKQGGYILEISSDAYRKRLSRAREQMRDFMINNCSLINSKNPCMCQRYAASDVANGVLTSDLVYAGKICRAKSNKQILKQLNELNELNKMKELFNSYSNLTNPENFVNHIKLLIQSVRCKLITE